MHEEINIVLVAIVLLSGLSIAAVYNHDGMLKELGSWATKRSRYLVMRDQLKTKVMDGSGGKFTHKQIRGNINSIINPVESVGVAIETHKDIGKLLTAMKKMEMGG